MEIFRIVLDINPSPFRVTLICRHWYHIVEGMGILQFSFQLGTWTHPEVVQRAVDKMARRLLSITVHTGRKQAGNPLGRCCIWWEAEGHKESLIASKEGIIDIE